MLELEKYQEKRRQDFEKRKECQSLSSLQYTKELLKEIKTIVEIDLIFKNDLIVVNMALSNALDNIKKNLRV